MVVVPIHLATRQQPSRNASHAASALSFNIVAIVIAIALTAPLTRGRDGAN